MADSDLERVQCPHCGGGVQVRLVRSLTPGCRRLQDLFSGRLNCVACPACGRIFRVATEIVYRDADLGLILVQEDLPEGGDPAQAVRMVDAMATEAAVRRDMARPCVRLVFDRQDFLEKLFLFRDRLDDRLVEYAKYQLFQTSPAGGLDHARDRLMYDPDESDGDHLQFLVFDRAAGGTGRSVRVDRKEYDAMAQEFQANPELAKELDRIFPDCHVTVDHLFEEERHDV